MIVKDIETMKKYVSTITGNDFDIFSPYVSTADDWLVNDIIGQKLFDIADKGVDDDKKLVLLCQRLITLNAYERAIPFLDLVQTNNGFAVASTDKLAPASRERVDTLINAAKTEQDTAIEALQQFLEENTKYHEAWKGSPSYCLLTDSFISSLKDFNRYISVNNANKALYPKLRREFISLHGALREAMLFKIIPVISVELSNLILSEIRLQKLSVANSKLLEPVRFALVNYSVTQIDKAEAFLRKANSFLLANPDNYPLWRDSAIGKAALTAKEDKNNKSIFFASW